MRYRIETERVDLFDVSIVITMCLHLSADVTFELLKTAFDKACSCHEVLRSKIVIEPDGEAYYTYADEQPDTDSMTNEQPDADNVSEAGADKSSERKKPVLDVKTKSCPGGDMHTGEDGHIAAGHGNSFTRTELSLEELIRENERRRFRIEDGEFIRGFASPDGIVLMMHHLAGDGKSLLYFVATFMRCLNGESCESVPFRSLDLKSLPQGSALPMVYKVLTAHWNRRWNRVKRIFTFDDMDAAYTKYWKNRETKVTIKRYEKHDLCHLLEEAKNINVSLTAYMITDMIRDSKGKNDIGLAVDGRTDGNRSMGNQATGISVEYRYDPKEAFGENARKVHALMNKKLSDNRYRYFVLRFMGALDTTLKDALNLEHAGCFSSRISSSLAQLLGYGTKVRDISITNLTRADIPLKYGEYEIKDIIFIPPVVSYAKNVYGIVTTGDVMYVTRHIFED